MRQIHESSRAMTYTLQHVSIPRAPGSDAATRAFYGDLLGLEELPAPATITAFDVIWFKLADGAELHVYDAANDGASALRHFCLVVENLETLRQKLESAGHRPWVDEPIRGRPRFFCRDSHGNSIEFTTIEADYRNFQPS